MKNQTLQIRGALVCDPTNHHQISPRNINIQNGKIVETFSKNTTPKIINAQNLIAMPGAIDMHAHITSPPLNHARAIQNTTTPHTPNNPPNTAHPDDAKLIPHTFATGYRYAALGYTTVIDAAIAPLDVLAANLQLQDIPNIDVGYLLLLADHPTILSLLAKNQMHQAAALAQHIIHRTAAYSIKLLNPLPPHTSPSPKQLWDIDQTNPHSNLTTRKIITAWAQIATQIKLPHPPHIHPNSIGLPGNAAVTQKTIHALQGLEAHLAHLQFHAYSQSPAGNYRSAAEQIANAINQNPNITADIGQISFGPAMAITHDTPLAHMLWQITNNTYHTHTHHPACTCAMTPLNYTSKSYANTIQWATGLELLLMIQNPWQIALTTDHPNGGSFLNYPTIIAQLMNKNLRDQHIQSANPKAIAQTTLQSLSREYTLQQIAILTRAAPAKILGLKNKGHLGPTADADITLYHNHLSDPLQMFEAPEYVIKGGQLVVKKGQIKDLGPQKRLEANIQAAPQARTLLEQWLNQNTAISPQHFGVR